MWDKNDWHQFFAIASKPWQRRRPPRPVYPSGTKRVLPAVGFSLSELDDAGINMEAAERLGLPVDAARIGAYGPNVSALREFVRSARQPGKTGIVRYFSHKVFGFSSTAMLSLCGFCALRIQARSAGSALLRTQQESFPTHPHRIALRRVPRFPQLPK